jgi:hypothetical protein
VNTQVPRELKPRYRWSRHFRFWFLVDHEFADTYGFKRWLR